MNPQDWLQYGALGLLALVLFGLGWGAKWFLTRLAKMFDDQTAVFREFAAAEKQEAIDHANIVSSISERISASAKETQVSFREALASTHKALEDRTDDARDRVIEAVKAR